MTRLRLPEGRSRWSGGGDEVLHNFHWAQSRRPDLFSDTAGDDVLWLVLRNNASLERLLARDYIILPQNAWAWAGNRPAEIRWKLRRLGFELTGELGIARSKGVVRLSESVPDRGRPSVLLPNVLSEKFEELIAQCAPLTRPVEEPYVYSFGNFIDYRNYHNLIASWRQLGDPRPLIIQGGVLSNVYLEQCRRAAGGDPRIRLIAERQTRTEILRHLMWADVVVFPSTAEASPISLLEAVELNNALVCQDIPAHRQSVCARLSDALVDVADPARLQAALARVGRCDRDVDPLSDLAVSRRVQAREQWLSTLATFVGSIDV